MEFEQLKAAWQHLGSTDARWAILTEPGREGGGWHDSEFWRSGVDCIKWVRWQLEGVDAIPTLGRALDFGCGHGRLTQALAEHFEQVVGIDVAESMVAEARAANRNIECVTFEHNPRPDLSLFAGASFDFVLTLIVLQHMRCEYSAAYLREFLRVLKPGGILFFQIPLESMAPPVAPPPPASAGEVASSLLDLRTFTRITPPFLDLPAGHWMWLRIDVHNVGEHTLCATSPNAVSVGVRCETLDGCAQSPVTWASLPHDLPPGHGASVLVPVAAPPTPGRYAVAAMPCFERRWCAQPQSSAASMRLGVGSARSESAPVQPPRPMRMSEAAFAENHIEMYATSLADVHAIITTAGGEFVEIGLDTMAGYAWTSAHCIVRKL